MKKQAGHPFRALSPFLAALLIALCAASLALSAFVTTTRAQTVETAIVKLANSNIEYFSRGEGEAIALLLGGTLTVGYLNGLADALAKAGYRVVGINFRGSGKSTGSSKGSRFRRWQTMWQESLQA